MKEKDFDPAEYVDTMSLLLDLQIDPEYRPGVVDNFAKIMAVAQLLNEFPLADEVEFAPIFQP